MSTAVRPTGEARWPQFSVLTAVGTPVPEHLGECLDSVAAQAGERVGPTDVEHVLVACTGDDATANGDLHQQLERAELRPGVSVVRPSETGETAASLSAALAAALTRASGDWIALLGDGDVLDPRALDLVSAAIDADDTVDVVYTDHDLVRSDGRHAQPSFKPDFSPEYLRSQNYVADLVVARRSLLEAVGGFRNGYEGAERHELVLRLTEAARTVAHVPHVLYHRRQRSHRTPRPSAVEMSAVEMSAEAAARRAVRDHCVRLGIDAEVVATEHPGCLRVVRRLGERPLVSVVIPTRGSSGRVWGVTRAFVVDAVRSIVERSTYGPIEFVVVADAETPAPVLHALDDIAGDRCRIVPYHQPFNFSAKTNLGVSAAAGDLLLLLNDDTELIAPDSIEVLVAHLHTPGVAMAGAKLLFDDGRLQHGGHVYNGDIGHACFGWRGDSPGPSPLRPLAVERECSGVTAAAALVHRAAFEDVGGFATELPLNYNDVDFSLKLRSAGHRIVWTPWASWYHFESRTRTSVVTADELACIERRWMRQLRHDPYYNPNLAPGRHDWLERPGLSGAPPPTAGDD